jgi:hypothetical protein
VRLLRIAQQRFAALDLGPMEAVNGTLSRFSRNARLRRTN